MSEVITSNGLQLETTILINPQYVGQVFDITQGVAKKKLLATYIAMDSTERIFIILYKSVSILNQWHIKVVKIIQDYETSRFLLKDPCKIVTAVEHKV